jgi:hypothetical protein
MFFLWWYLWIAPHILLGACLVSLLRRRLQRQYPIFTTYIISYLVYFLALLATDCLIRYQLSSLLTYRWVLVAGTGATELLGLGVLYKIASELLVSRSSLAQLSRILLRWVAAILLLASALASGLLSKPGMERLISIFQTLDFTSNLIKLGLLLVMLLFTRALHISWRTLPAGIVLGFGISACTDMAGSALLSAVGKSGYVVVDLIGMSAFHLCAAIWLVYILLPERLPRFVGAGLKKSDLEFWDQELQRMVRQ